MEKEASKINDSEIRSKTLKQLTEENPGEYLELVNRKVCQAFVAGKYAHSGYDIEILEDPVITQTKLGNPGYEFYARAFKDKLPVGFGPDGTIEIERFRIFGFANFLIEDSEGPIEKTIAYRESPEGEILFKIKRYREDLLACVLRDLVHTIKQVGKDGKNIEKGKVGRTTDTFNPVRGNGYGHGYFTYRTETAPESGTFAQWRASATAAKQGMSVWNFHTPNYDPDYLYLQMNQLSGSAWQWNVRSAFQFDTSSIADTEVVSAATFSVSYDNSLVGPKADDLTSLLGITGFTPANPTAWVKGDQNNYGSTRYASDLAFASIAAEGSYTDWAFNASGIAAVSLTGYTAMMLRLNWDIDNSNPGTTGVHQTLVGFDQGEDAQPPKLVVVHAPGGSSRSPAGGVAYGPTMMY